jgi:hypothetical protein
MATSRLSAVHLPSIMNKSILPDEKEKYNIKRKKKHNYLQLITISITQKKCKDP